MRAPPAHSEWSLWKCKRSRAFAFEATDSRKSGGCAPGPPTFGRRLADVHLLAPKRRKVAGRSAEKSGGLLQFPLGPAVEMPAEAMLMEKSYLVYGPLFSFVYFLMILGIVCKCRESQFLQIVAVNGITVSGSKRQRVHSNAGSFLLPPHHGVRASAKNGHLLRSTVLSIRMAFFPFVRGSLLRPAPAFRSISSAPLHELQSVLCDVPLSQLQGGRLGAQEGG